MSQTASVTAQGAILHLSDIVSFVEEITALHVMERNTANLGSIEPNLKVRLEKADSLGHINVMFDLTNDQMTEEHRFRSQIDITYLPDIQLSCLRLLDKFPIRGKP